MTDRTFSIPALYAWRLKTVGSPLVNIDFFFFHCKNHQFSVLMVIAINLTRQCALSRLMSFLFSSMLPFSTLFKQLN